MEYINKYFETYPGVKEFLDGLVADAKETGLCGQHVWPKTSHAGTEIRQFHAAFLRRAGGHELPDPGNSGGHHEDCHDRVDRELKAEGLKSRIVLQVHDELLVETRKDEVEAVKALLVDKMKHAADLNVSLEVEANVGDSWFDAK